MKYTHQYLLAILLFTNVVFGQRAKQELPSFKFDFGKGAESKTGININNKILYTDELGYGFDDEYKKDLTLNKTSFSSKKIYLLHGKSTRKSL